MFPARSDFKSPSGGAAWWNTVAPTDKSVLVWQSQWWTIVFFVQSRLKDLLKKNNVFTFAVNPEGTCFSGSLSEIPASLQANSHETDSIRTDGVWDKDASETLAAFLCLTGDTNAAKQVMVDAAYRRVSLQTMRFILWVAFMLPDAAVNLQADQVSARVSQAARDNGTGIVIPNDAIMPTWDDKMVPDARDQKWFAMSAAKAPLPNPISMGGGTRPWPANAPGVSQNTAITNIFGGDSSGGVGLLGVVAMAGIGVLALGAIGSGTAVAASSGGGVDFRSDPKPQPLLEGMRQTRAIKESHKSLRTPPWARIPSNAHHSPVGDAMAHAAKMRPPGTVVVEKGRVSLDEALKDARTASHARPGSAVVLVEDAKERVREGGVAYNQPHGRSNLTYEDAVEILDREARSQSVRPHRMYDGEFTRVMLAAKKAKAVEQGRAPIRFHKPVHRPKGSDKDAIRYGTMVGNLGKMPSLTVMHRKGFSDHEQTVAERVAAETIERRAHHRLHGGSETTGEREAREYGERVGRLGRKPDVDKMRKEKFTWEEIAIAQEAAADRREARSR